MFRPILATLLIATTPVLAADGHDHETEEHAFAIGDFVVEHAWTPATTSREALVYMLLHNLGDEPVTLEGAASEAAEAAGLVGIVLKDGAETTVPLPSVPVPAGREMELAPGIMAVALTGLREPLQQGGHLELVLTTSAGELEVEAEIGAADATQHSHAGHSHLGDLHDHD